MKTLEALVRSFAEMHPEGAARALERLDEKEAAGILTGLPASVVGPVAERLAPHAAGAILTRFTPDQTRDMLEAMTPRQAIAVLHHIEPERREVMLTSLPDLVAQRFRELLKYPEDTAGGMMDPQVVSLPIDVTVQEALKLIRMAPRESLHYLYVADRDLKLVGTVGMRDIMLASSRDPIRSLVRGEIYTIPATMDREEVASVMRHRRFLALPVVDDDGRLLGVVKHDEVIDAVQEEAFEDLQKMVGAGGDEHAAAPVGEAVRRRLPWLMVNLATAFTAAAVIGVFEQTIAILPALAVLMSVVAGQGGNTGAQALAVMIRGLAVGEVIPRSAWRVLLKEVLAGLVNGLVVAVLTAPVVYLWYQNFGLCLVIGLAMVANMVIAGLAGAAIPLMLKALGRDPAQSSSIFMTTVTDVVGFGVFLGLALAFMPLLR